jgi:hypothetical protein
MICYNISLSTYNLDAADDRYSFSGQADRKMALRYRSGHAVHGRREAILDLTVRVRILLNVGDDTVVSISGHQCGDPDCGESSTTILLMRPERPTSRIRIAKPPEAVTAADLQAALLPLVSQQAHREP